MTQPSIYWAVMWGDAGQRWHSHPFTEPLCEGMLVKDDVQPSIYWAIMWGDAGQRWHSHPFTEPLCEGMLVRDDTAIHLLSDYVRGCWSKMTQPSIYWAVMWGNAGQRWHSHPFTEPLCDGMLVKDDTAVHLLSRYVRGCWSEMTQPSIYWAVMWGDAGQRWHSHPFTEPLCEGMLVRDDTAIHLLSRYVRGCWSEMTQPSIYWAVMWGDAGQRWHSHPFTETLCEGMLVRDDTAIHLLSRYVRGCWSEMTQPSIYWALMWGDAGQIWHGHPFTEPLCEGMLVRDDTAIHLLSRYVRGCWSEMTQPSIYWAVMWGDAGQRWHSHPFTEPLCEGVLVRDDTAIHLLSRYVRGCWSEMTQPSIYWAVMWGDAGQRWHSHPFTEPLCEGMLVRDDTAIHLLSRYVRGCWSEMTQPSIYWAVMWGDAGQRWHSHPFTEPLCEGMLVRDDTAIHLLSRYVRGCWSEMTQPSIYWALMWGDAGQRWHSHPFTEPLCEGMLVRDDTAIHLLSRYVRAFRWYLKLDTTETCSLHLKKINSFSTFQSYRPDQSLQFQFNPHKQPSHWLIRGLMHLDVTVDWFWQCSDNLLIDWWQLHDFLLCHVHFHRQFMKG